MAKFGSEFLVLWSAEVIHFWSSLAKTQEKPFTDLFEVCVMIKFLQQRIVLTWDVESEAQKQLWHFGRPALPYWRRSRRACRDGQGRRWPMMCFPASKCASVKMQACVASLLSRYMYELVCTSRLGKRGTMIDRAETGSKGLDSEEERCFDLVRGLRRITVESAWAIKLLVCHFHPFFHWASSGLLFHPSLTKDNQTFHVCLFSCVRR